MPLANIPPALQGKYEDCIKKVKAKGETGNAYAICYSSVVEGANAASIAEMFNLKPGVEAILRELGSDAEAFTASEQVAFEPFRAFDPAKPFRILPLGKFYRGDRVLSIDQARAEQIVANFKRQLPRYGAQINVEHGGDGTQPGRIGTIRDVALMNDGVYVTRADWSEAGKRLIDEDRYQGVSPEIVWTLNNNARYQDPETGSYHDNVLTGLALTTSPFFGSHVAVFSAKENFMNDMQGGMPPGMMQNQGGNPPPEKQPGQDQGGDPIKQTIVNIAQMLKALLAKLDGGNGGDQPPTPPKPQPQAPPAQNASATPNAGNYSAAIIAAPDPTALIQSGGKPMSEPIKQPAAPTAEEFAAVKAQSAQQAAQVEEFKAKLEQAEARGNKLAEDFAAERALRRTREFNAEAEKFKTLPSAKPEDLGAHLMWLNDADTTEKKEHYSYFAGVLTAANAAIGQSALFSQLGSARVGGDTPAEHPFIEAVEKIRVERFGTKPYSEGFAEAFKIAEGENKDLARDYARQRHS